MEALATLAPYLFFAASLIFIVVAGFHIKHLRRKDMEEQIALQEQVLNEKYDHISDDDAIDAINELERRSGYIIKKE